MLEKGQSILEKFKGCWKKSRDACRLVLTFTTLVEESWVKLIEENHIQ